MRSEWILGRLAGGGLDSTFGYLRHGVSAFEYRPI
jgi:hypothetical protein